MPQPSKATDRRLQKLQAQLAEVGFALPGTINVAMNRCGKANCACHQDPPKLHGPYITWTRKVPGKTVTRRLTPKQLERYKPWFENDRRLRELTKQLEASLPPGRRAGRGMGQRTATRPPAARPLTRTNVVNRRSSRGQPRPSPENPPQTPKREDLITRNPC